MKQPMTIDEVMEAGVEMMVVQYLPLPSEKTSADLEWLNQDIAHIDIVPLTVYDDALPSYLATGRPLALLDLKHSDQYSFDRLAQFIMSDAWLCARTLAGLETGLARNQIRRARAHSKNDKETVSALAALEKVIEAEIKKFSLALRTFESKAGGHMLGTPPTTKTRTSWTD